jgi:hypothetical protein
MASNPYKYYLTHMHDKSGYRAIWDPGRNMELGYIGKLDATGSFTVYTSLENEGIPMVRKPESSPVDEDYSSTEGIDINAKLSGEIPLAGSILTAGEAGFNINFTKRDGVVFKTTGQVTEELINMAAIEKVVLEKYDTKNWEKDWLIITKLVRAKSATIIISNSSKCMLDLKAKTDIGAGQLKLTDASLGLTLAKESGSSMKFIAQAGITPLYQLMGIVHPMFSRPQFLGKGPTDGERKLSDQPFDPKELEDQDD